MEENDIQLPMIPLEVLAALVHDAGMCDCLREDRSGYVFTRGVAGVSDEQLQTFARLITTHTIKVMMKMFVGASLDVSANDPAAHD